MGEPEEPEELDWKDRPVTVRHLFGAVLIVVGVMLLIVGNLMGQGYLTP